MSKNNGMGKKLKEIRKRFKLDSHHGAERFGIFVGAFALTGALVFGSAGASSFQNSREVLGDTALYNTQFTTSKTELMGQVDGVYSSADDRRALVMMHFEQDSPISYNAADYQAFLLGSTPSMTSKPVSTDGVSGSFHVFGSTGYVGVLLDAEEPFDKQILNLTVRANAELAYSAEDVAAQAAEEAGVEDDGGVVAEDGEENTDASFDQFDQWEVYVNPGAAEVEEIPALDEVTFDPARAFYDVVLSKREDQARAVLDQKLLEMRADLNQVEAYTEDLKNTEVDGVRLMMPEEPSLIAGDEVTGQSAKEAGTEEATLALESDTVVAGGLALDWREGDVYSGYMDELLEPGQTTSQFLAAKEQETLDATSVASEVESLEWKLTDGSNLAVDYQSSDVTMRPLINVMNNLTGAYTNYGNHKTEYQTTLTTDLLAVEIDMRDVRNNGSVNSSEEFLTIYE